MAGTSSRAATKCISEVPGFEKQTSTPQSTRVLMTACAPFMAGSCRRVGRPGRGSRSNSTSGLRIPFGSKAALIRRIRAILAGSSSSLKYRFLASPMPCSAEMAPPRSMPERKSSLSRRARLSSSEQKIPRCTLPSPAWPQPAIHASYSAASAETRSMNVAIWARGTTMSMMSSAPLALAIQNAFSRASMSCGRRRRRQHEHVEGTEAGELLRQAGGRPRRVGSSSSFSSTTTR